ARYDVDPARGDQMTYVHLNRPQFVVFGRKIEFDLRSRNWQLHVMKRLGFLRRWLPQWHAPEKAFRDWYTGIVDGFQIFHDEAVYRQYVEALQVPAGVRGYRQIRAPKMDAARARAEEILGSLKLRRPAEPASARRP
ncbi:MAG TPA: indolepyruvate ferredoxin oxidoreductase, partial [Elusimicrobiota bacterium]|nr:indolepyruvate ferredoxin oxidoreductase [Elusimicrobiota bacterium]